MVKFIDKNIIPFNISKLVNNFYKNHKNYIIKEITDKNHPCYTQSGLFSTKKWQENEIVGEYRGEIIDIYNSKKGFHSDYFAGFNVDGLQGIGIDAQEVGNEMRFINHYKGISNEPNVKFVNYMDGIFIRIMVVCIREINVGEELVVDYGYEP